MGLKEPLHAAADLRVGDEEGVSALGHARKDPFGEAFPGMFG